MIISDSSPLISLARIGQLYLLQRLYGTLVVPQAVWNEVAVQGAGQAGAEEVRLAAWIKTLTVANNELVLALQRDLGAGEAEAIALAVEKKADLLLMDERLGRETALYFGIHCIGLLGVLTEAKLKGKVEAIKPILDLLRNRAGYRISDILYQQVLQGTGENN